MADDKRRPGQRTFAPACEPESRLVKRIATPSCERVSVYLNFIVVGLCVFGKVIVWKYEQHRQIQAVSNDPQ